MSIIIKSGNSSDVAKVNSDGELSVTSDTQTHNGTTWEKAKTANAAAGTTGTGVPAAGNMGFDGTNWQRLKSGTTGDLAVSITNPAAAAAGMFAGVNPFGQLQVAGDGMPIFTDVFEGGVIDTVNRWATSGTVTPTIVSSNLLINPATTASATSVVSTLPSFVIATSIILGVSIVLESGTTATGNHRFWGFGLPPSPPGTAAAPVQDGVGFEVDTTGQLRASCYNAGTRISTQALGPAPTDGLGHTYVVLVRGDIAFFYKDAFDLPTAVSYVGPSVKNLPLRFASLNSAAVTGTPTMLVSGMSVVDNARSGAAINDGTFAWRKARVDATGALSVVGRPSDLVVSVTAAASTALTATLPAAGAGLYHYITKIAVTKYCTIAITGTAAPTVVTTTNIPGSLAYTMATAMAIGTTIDRLDDYADAPLKVAAANTATTIVAPLVTNALWRINVQYFVGP